MSIRWIDNLTSSHHKHAACPLHHTCAAWGHLSLWRFNWFCCLSSRRRMSQTRPTRSSYAWSFQKIAMGSFKCPYQEFQVCQSNGWFMLIYYLTYVTTPTNRLVTSRHGQLATSVEFYLFIALCPSISYLYWSVCLSVRPSVRPPLLPICASVHVRPCLTISVRVILFFIYRSVDLYHPIWQPCLSCIFLPIRGFLLIYLSIYLIPSHPIPSHPIPSNRIESNLSNLI